MDQLERLYSNNVGIGARQLYVKALKEGIPVSKRVVDDLIARKGESQLFQQRKPSDGESAPRDETEARTDFVTPPQDRRPHSHLLPIFVCLSCCQVF